MFSLFCLGLFTAPLWGNIYMWVDALRTGHGYGFILESFACALLGSLLFVATWVYRFTELKLPLHVATHTLISFGSIFCAADLQSTNQWIRVLALLGFRANLMGVFLWDFSATPRKKCPDLPAGDGV